MALRKTIPLEYIEDLPIPPILGNYVVSEIDDTSPYAALLWADIRRAMRKARLSKLQQVVFEMWVRGLQQSQIEIILSRDKKGIYDALTIAQEKMDKQEVGTLTVLVEQFGWKAVQEVYK